MNDFCKATGVDDSAARARALALESFIVEAPAGAGKTELLTQRLLRLLANVDQPEAVVAITFTNKAAAEMRERVLTNLESAAHGAPPEAPHRRLTHELAEAVLACDEANGWGLLAQPGRLRILTIDALCGMIARQQPILSGFGALPVVSDDAERLYDEAARVTLAKLEQVGPEAEVVAAALAYLDNDRPRVQSLVASLLARRDQWRDLEHAGTEHFADVLARSWAKMLERDIARAAEALGTERLREIVACAAYAAGNLPDHTALAELADGEWPLPVQAAALSRWQTLQGFLMTSTGWRKPGGIKVGNGFPATAEGKAPKLRMQALLDDLAQAPPAVAEAVAGLARLPASNDITADHLLVRAIIALLNFAEGELQAVFRAQGEVDFIEVAARAVQSLREPADGAAPSNESGPSELALRLDYAIQHLLVDEFQDTSPAQVDLLKQLTAGWTAGDGRTLFCVGDPMQSIYRFRKADVGLFLEAGRTGIGQVPLKRLALSANYRSSPSVVDWVNARFAGLFPAEDDPANGQIAYRHFHAARTAVPEGFPTGVWAHVLVAEQGPEGDEDAPPSPVDAAEAEYLIAIAEGAWRDDPKASVAVLVRARTHLAPLLAALRRRPDAPRAMAVEVEALADRQWVADAVSLTRALLHRADRVHWLAVLRAPWCGLTLADLLTLAGDDAVAKFTTLWSRVNDEAVLAQLSADGRLRAQALRAVFVSAWAAQGHQAVATWVEGVWRALRGPDTLPDARAETDVLAYFGLLSRLEARGRPWLDRLDTELSRLYSAPDPLADPNAGHVLQLMTIHKAKGLEFDVVIIPGLHRQMKGEDDFLLRWEQVPLGGPTPELLVAPYASSRSNGGRPTPYSLLKRLAAERGANEDLRVLYVGATRAVRALHWVGIAKPDQKEEGAIKPPAGTALATLWPAIERDVQRIDVPPMALGNGVPYEEFVPPLLRLPSAAFASPATRGTLTKAQAGGNEPASLNEVSKTVRHARAALGTVPLAARQGEVVHRLLELMGKQGQGAWSAERIQSCHSGIVRQLQQLGLAPEQLAPATAEVLHLLQKFAASAAGQWALKPRPEMASEQSWVEETAEGRREWVIDRTFVEDGVRWIVDYKTADLGPAPSSDELQASAESYREQLHAYARLLVGEVHPVRLAVLFVRYGARVVLER